MSRYRTVLMLALASFFCASCKNEPPDTRALDERAIRAADAATLKAAQANDVDRAVANYASLITSNGFLSSRSARASKPVATRTHLSSM